MASKAKKIYEVFCYTGTRATSKDRFTYQPEQVIGHARTATAAWELAKSDYTTKGFTGTMESWDALETHNWDIRKVDDNGQCRKGGK